MIKELIRFKNRHPFITILMIGLLLRIIAAIFSKGFGMHDDHFLVIEPAASWVDGGDYTKWLPWTGNTPQGHSFFYVGLNYLLISFLKFLGINSPQAIMFINRLLHAFLSLFVISFGYRIASLISNKKTAYLVALLLSAYWFMPFASVRNLVEIVSIPFLLYGTLIILRQELIRKEGASNYHRTSFLIAGFFLGLAFSVRFQTLFYTAGICLALLIAKNWKGFFITTLGIVISIVLVQGGIDFMVWGKPFAELTEYVVYNMEHATSYFNKPWYNYLIVIFGLLIPPISLMLLWGFFRSWKKHYLLFLPVFCFLLFHSIFPNKQERFIFPIIPMIIILGTVGWNDFVQHGIFWKKHRKLEKSFWIFFAIVNTIALVFITPMYSKKSRVESMSYLRNYPQTTYFLVEDTKNTTLRFPPVFYTGFWPEYNAIMKKDGNNERSREISFETFERFKDWHQIENQPAFILFYQLYDIENRVETMKNYFPDLEYETTTTPSFMDLLLHRINPRNANESIVIYRNKTVIPEKFDQKK